MSGSNDTNGITKEVVLNNINVLPKGVLLAQFIKDSNEMDNDALQKKYRISARTLRRYRQRVREAEIDISANSFPESPSAVLDQFLKLDYPKVLVLGDCEIPDHNPRVFDLAALLAKRLGIKHLIVNGDFLALDSLSKWPKDGGTANFLADIEIARETLRTFLNNFETVDFLTGNHEQRLAHKIDGQFNIGEFFKNLDYFQYSEYSYCNLRSGGREIIVCHPVDYSRTPLAVPRRLAALHHKDILCGHTHRLAMGYDDSGKYQIVEGGHCRDESRTRYKQMRMSSHPRWNQGFTLILNGYIHLVNEINANFWLNNVAF